ncbi:MAG: hypothetical protein RML14_03180 [Meiothermus sp.]|uniref:type II secretion system protein n=1 Tax=Meiothermus sp. TaxID=1955249 RepID=UPI00298F0223|nr:hypothetical protein [Meiothermus sp.]MDW8480893.1 hypothetical protein [Meiothermus sp.]
MTLVEMAVGIAFLGILALGLSLLFSQLAEGSLRAQEEAQVQADLLALRGKLERDALSSTTFLCTGSQARLATPAGLVVYRLEDERVRRNGEDITQLSGYGGGFTCDGRTLLLSLTWRGNSLATLRFARRVGLPGS